MANVEEVKCLGCGANAWNDDDKCARRGLDQAHSSLSAVNARGDLAEKKLAIAVGFLKGFWCDDRKFVAHRELADCNYCAAMDTVAEIERMGKEGT